jgi:hypothetical protein
MRFMKLQNAFGEKTPGYTQWNVSYAKVDRVFMKTDAGVLMMTRSLEQAVSKLNANIRKLAELVKRQEGQIAALRK